MIRGGPEWDSARTVWLVLDLETVREVADFLATAEAPWLAPSALKRATDLGKVFQRLARGEKVEA